ncbi:hypothetical protein K0M31_004110, partial [Melipona bicolor]
LRWAQRSAAERAGRARAKLARTGCVERAFSDVEGLTGVTHVAYTGPGHVLAARQAPPIACQSGRVQGRPRACALGRASVPSTTPSLAFSQLSSLRCTPRAESTPSRSPPPPRHGPANPALNPPANVVTITDAADAAAAAGSAPNLTPPPSGMPKEPTALTAASDGTNTLASTYRYTRNAVDCYRDSVFSSDTRERRSKMLWIATEVKRVKKNGIYEVDKENGVEGTTREREREEGCFRNVRTKVECLIGGGVGAVGS